MYIMTQVPGKSEEPCLPHGLSVVNTYTELTPESRCVAIVIKNQTTADRVPPVEVLPATLEKLDEMQGM